RGRGGKRIDVTRWLLAVAGMERELHEVAVPGAVKVLAPARAHAFQGDRDEVAAVIAVVRSVERLVDVTDQMHHPLERLVALARRRARIAEHPDEPLELLAVALTVRTIACLLFAAADRHVIVVPGRARSRCAVKL